MKDKLTVTRGEVGGDIGGLRGKGHQGTCIKDTWTKPKGSRVGGGDSWSRGVVGVKWRQLYLNNNKKRLKISKIYANLFSLCQVQIRRFGCHY